LSGGEPILFPTLHQVLQGLWDLGLIVTITTNGFNEKVLRKTLDFLKAKDSKKTRIRVSIDGAAPRHEQLRGPGTYKRALAAVTSIRETLGWIGVNTVVSPATVLHIEELCANLVSANVDHWALITEAPRGNLALDQTPANQIFEAIDNVEMAARKCGFVAQIEKWDYLNAPHSYLLIEPNGKMVIPGTMERDDIAVGDVSNPDLLLLEKTLHHLRETKNAVFFTWDHRPYFQ